MSPPRRCRGDDGISLVELMVAVGLMVLIVPLAFPMLTSTLTTATRLEARSGALDELRTDVGNMTRETATESKVVAEGLVAGDAFQYIANPRQQVVIHLSINLGNDRAPIRLDATSAPRTWHSC